MIKGTIENLDVVISGLDGFGLDVREAAFYGILEAIDLAFVACQHVLSEGDHTLRELAQLGHPYGFAHPQEIHSPDILVHVQSGEYRDSLRKISPRGAGGEIFEGRIVSDSDKDRWIQEGTVHMRARPWMEWIVQNYGNDYADLIEARINAAIGKHAA